MKTSKLKQENNITEFRTSPFTDEELAQRDHGKPFLGEKCAHRGHHDWQESGDIFSCKDCPQTAMLDE